MRVAWVLVVAWSMVVATTTHGTRDDHRSGVSIAAAVHHPLRQRDLSSLTPFVAPAQLAMWVPPRAGDVAAAADVVGGSSTDAIAPVARGPPVG